MKLQEYESMNIVADISLYPLKNGPVPDIIDFIKDLRGQEGIEIISNQLSSQIRGEFAAVTCAIHHCMRKAMTTSNTVVLVVKYLNIDVQIEKEPSLTPRHDLSIPH
jgi:hypothetical protein